MKFGNIIMVSVHICGFSGGADADIADPFCSLEIPNHLLYAWHTQKKKKLYRAVE